ncbi:MAG TPA: transcription elongation factor GreA [Gammaproteobacteria bacterium]|jgi:transcription elongation factor GreA|nr:transcription elongation factor GreA [Gammaproteobacteria bacterium]
MSKVPMTVQGEAKLRMELDQLKRVERPNIINAIAEARAHGDLKENAEYHAAKERQGFIEGRIKEVESALSLAQVIDITKIENDGKVIFGATIELIDENGKTIRYQIVGQDEADLKEGKISVTSPVARALIGKYEGDVVDAQTPEGKAQYEIASVEYL